MESNNYFHPNHHGFRSGHSTATALLQMYNSWVEDIDKQLLEGLIDLSAAFDVVDAELLVAKLGFYWFSSQTKDWVQSYMSGRSQRCYLEGCLFTEISTAGERGALRAPSSVHCSISSSLMSSQKLFMIIIRIAMKSSHGSPESTKNVSSAAL